MNAVERQHVHPKVSRVHRHFLVVVGNWKFENWRLYRLREHQNHSGKVRWHMWDKV